MFKKFVAWVKALFVPVVIREESVDQFINAQRRVHTEPVIRKVEAPVVEPVVQKSPVTPPKPLNEQLKGVELPSYAKGKTLPPKAKRQYIKQAQSAPARKFSESPASYGSSQVHHNSGIDPVNAAVYGYAAATILDDTPAAAAPVVEECRSSSSSSYSPSYSSYDDSSSYSSSSSSSYDSGSYDSGSSYSSCD